MSSTARPEGTSSAVSRLGFKSGQIVQELGWDEDVDESLRQEVEDAIDGELVEEAMEPVDVVLLWWRDEDGDIIDGLFDAITDLNDTGYVWLLTPKVGREGFVDATDLNEGAVTAGLTLTSTVPVSAGWTASKLVPPKGPRR
ncbi:DUF3052 domain-containing protein [Microlunatus soli]|uniref:DUF3052 domain-containing protein n=1 Tax=Microlunatus soli TaxID=630515 RepID=A0A1H1Z757_9ACTN|nr:DUF3052 domain-containing protein [Microlunatus soli]SDT29046.1 Protein of unknown function [Microlunatus soli]